MLDDALSVNELPAMPAMSGVAGVKGWLTETVTVPQVGEQLRGPLMVMSPAVQGSDVQMVPGEVQFGVPPALSTPPDASTALLSAQSFVFDEMSAARAPSRALPAMRLYSKTARPRSSAPKTISKKTMAT